MKKLTALFLALAMLLPLVGCAADDVETITFWHCMSEHAGIMLDEQVKLFNDTVGKESPRPRSGGLRLGGGRSGGHLRRRPSAGRADRGQNHHPKNQM